MENGMGIATFGLIGLGRMGANMARRLARAGRPVLTYDPAEAARAAVAGEKGLTAVAALPQLTAGLNAPRIVWIMVPAGAPTEQTVDALAPLLAPGDLIVDGGNADYRDSQRRAAALSSRGIDFVDAGVSGGIWGLEAGYGLMVGGPVAAVDRLQPWLEALAPAADRGWVHCGAAGSGHYVKMVHNGIEYGLMQAYAEGFALMQAQPEFKLDLAAIAEAWRSGTVIRSWLLDLAASALQGDAQLSQVPAYVADSGEGRWTLREGIDQGTPTPVLAAALMARFASQGRGDYAARFLAQLRHVFGGHPTGKPR
jgi:6-phosphogluconate dehydrogenase